jgi:hypothetical protein
MKRRRQLVKRELEPVKHVFTAERRRYDNKALVIKLIQFFDVLRSLLYR